VEVVRRIEQKASPLAILGIPGVGKTSIAKAILYEDQVINQFGARRHWADVGEVASLDNFREVLFHGLTLEAPPPSKISPDTKYLHSKTPTRRPRPAYTIERLAAILDGFRTSALPSILILNDLDDAWSHNQTDVQQILEELRNIPHLTIVVTMRGATGLPQDWSRLEVSPLSPRGAKLMFFNIYPNSDNQLDSLLQKVYYLPQLINFMAHLCRVNQVKPSDLLKQWNGEGGVLSLQEDLEGVNTTLISWVKSASNQVRPEARMILSILSILPSGALHEDLQCMLPSLNKIPEMTRILSDLSLISIQHGARLQIPASIRSYSLKYNQLDIQSRNEVYNHYFDLTRDGLYQPGHKGFTAAIERLTKEQHNIEAILDDALGQGCIVAVEATLQYSTPRYAMKPRMDVIEKALKIARKESPTSLMTAACLRRLGEMCVSAGSFGRGDRLLREAAPLLKDNGEDVAAAHCWIGIARSIWINEQAKAIDRLEILLEEFAELRDLKGQATCSLLLGEWYLGEGRQEEGCLSIEDALSKFNQLSDRHGVAKCQISLAQVYLHQSRLDDARTALEVLPILRAFGDRSALANGLGLLASLCLNEGRVTEARLAKREALEQLKALGQELNAAFYMQTLASYSDDEDATKLYEKAIPVFWAFRFIYHGAESRLHLGLRYMAMGQYDSALLHLEIAKPELERNGTDWLAKICRAAIIFCLRSDPENESQLAHAAQEMENYGDVLFAAARQPTSTLWIHFGIMRKLDSEDGDSESQDEDDDSDSRGENLELSHDDSGSESASRNRETEIGEPKTSNIASNLEDDEVPLDDRDASPALSDVQDRHVEEEDSNVEDEVMVIFYSYLTHDAVKDSMVVCQFRFPISRENVGLLPSSILTSL